MPRRSAGARLYLDRKRKQWAIRDGQRFIRTGRPEADRGGAEKVLGEYLAAKYQPAKSASPNLADVLLVYSKERVPLLRTAKNTAYKIGSLERWWGDKNLSDVNARNCRAYAQTKTPAAARSDLETLQSAIKYWHKEYGPLAVMPSLVLPDRVAPRERWLTRNEAARLLKHARRTPHLARFILLGLYTGSRAGVLKAVEWSWIDFEAGIMRRLAPGTRAAGNKRRPPVRLGKRILSHLRRWHRLEGNIKLVVHYNGKAVDDPHTSWDRATLLAGLEEVTPHTLRHTRATWMMQGGVDPWEAAGSLGMSVRVLEQVYGHHHPAWQQNAAEV